MNMNAEQLPEHLTTFMKALHDNPALIDAATAAVGDRTGSEALNAAAAYYQAQGYTITAEELLALQAASKTAAGEELNDDELQAIAGGDGFDFTQWIRPRSRPTPGAFTYPGGTVFRLPWS